MSREKAPVFVDRRAYRRRRMADAARILPIFGTILICIPLLWRDKTDAATPVDIPDGASTGAVMIYLFAVWVILAILAAVISGYLSPVKLEEDAADGVAE